jgi:hypothetical protein
MSDVVCQSVLSYERFVDYWFGDLPSAEEDLLESHLVECPHCARLADIWSADTLALAAGARLLPRSFVTMEQLAAMGDAVKVIDVEDHPISLRLDKDAIHVFRVTLEPEVIWGLDRLDVEYLKEGYDEPIFHVSKVPLDSDSDPLHFACHGHVLDAHGDATMRLIGTRGGERFTVLESLVHFE